MVYKTRVWFRLFRQKIYPWTIFAIAACKFVYLCGNEQDREKARLMVSLAKIDFVAFYAFINDLLW
ncbi:MAG: hypothetical protein KME05_09465 [Gloeocapsa sp. UFS-A4-WI-NPMV-4B04]|jgi:hypothetical protein|nr:hypothetical protein [Gloeocapsa sp. UFS-A4-WI-NPMV-4B04]